MVKHRTATLWTFPATILCLFTLSPRWWHPSCARPDGGVPYFATGLPLPFMEAGDWSSMVYSYLPLVMLIDAVALWIGFSLLFRRIFGGDGRKRSGIALGIGVGLSGLTASFLIALATLYWFGGDGPVPRWSFPGDPLASYRPAGWGLAAEGFMSRERCDAN
jgi:hypothetical protein